MGPTAVIMAKLLYYGADSTLALDLGPEALVAQCNGPRGTPLEDVASEVAGALDEPLDFPPLRRATVPGDRVVLALDHHLPQAPALVCGVVGTLLGSGIEPRDISLVRSQAGVQPESEDLTAMLAPDVSRAITVLDHDPRQRAGLAYLAASRDARPIYMNRAICDADLVLPIGCLRLESSWGYLGVHGGLYPAFADHETQQSYFQPGRIDSPGQQQRRRGEADEAVRLLGVQLTIQVIPGGGDSVLDVLAGSVDAVHSRGRDLCEAAWNYEVPQRASLVVATVEGSPQHQTWENFARALFAASRAVADDGAIAVCMDLATDPSPAWQRIAAADDIQAAIRQIGKDGSPAAQLAHTLDRAKVYLLSHLDQEVVEPLGVAYVADANEIARLSSRHDSCIVLRNAQYAVPTPLEDRGAQTC